MQAIEPPVSKALVLVCEKCGKRLDKDENVSRELVSRVKKRSKKLFGKGEVRALTTSCMDICPDDAVSVAITTFEGRPSTRFFTVEVDDVDKTSQRILEEVQSRNS